MGASVCREWTQAVGLRLLVARRGSWYWEGRRWVVRAVVPEAGLLEHQRDAWREAAATWLLSPDDDERLAIAAQWGIPVLANLASSDAGRAERIVQRLATAPAVIGLLVVHPDLVPLVRRSAPQLMIVQSWNGAHTGTSPQPLRPDAWLWTERQVEAAASSSAPEVGIDRDPAVQVPRMVLRPTRELVGLPARVEVDRLQAASARWGSFAGYRIAPEGWESAAN
jgi:hypothetical protein